MNLHSKAQLTCHGPSGLPLFDWQPIVIRKPLTRAGDFIVKKYRVAPELADLIARLAGFEAEAV